MNRKIAIASVEPNRLAELSHGLQTLEGVAFYAPAPLFT